MAVRYASGSVVCGLRKGKPWTGRFAGTVEGRRRQLLYGSVFLPPAPNAAAFRAIGALLTFSIGIRSECIAAASSEYTGEILRHEVGLELDRFATLGAKR